MTKRTNERSAAAEAPAAALVACYDRISLDREQTQAGIDRQHEDNQRAARRLYPRCTVRRYSDNSISALKGKYRPGFEALRDDIVAGLVRIVVAWHPDRLTRNMAELEELISLLDEHNVLVHTVQGGAYDLSNPTSRMAARIVGAVAQHESEHKGVRVRAKHQELKKLGKRAGGPTPYGYSSWSCLPWVNGKGEEQPAVLVREALAMQQAFKRVEAGDTLTEVAAWLNAEGVTSARGHDWDHRLLGSVMRRPHLAALLKLDGKLVKGEWEPIIDPPTWHRVQALLSAPERKKRNPAIPYLLHGLVVAPDGSPLVGRYCHGRYNKSEKGPWLRYYLGSGVAVREDDLDGLVMQRVFDRCRPGLALTSDPDADHRAVAEAEVKRLRATHEKLDAAFDADALSVERYRDRAVVLRGKIADAEARLAQFASVDSRVVALVSAPGSLEDEWPGLPTNERRQALRAVLERVVVAPATVRGRYARIVYHPERVTIEWAGGRQRRR